MSTLISGLIERTNSADRPGAPRSISIASVRQQSVHGVQGFQDRDVLTRLDPNENPQLWEQIGANNIRAQIGEEMTVLRSGFAQFRNALLIKGLCRDDAPPPAPYTGHSRFSDIPTTLMNLFGIIHLMGGYSFAYTTENDGRLVRDVVAREGAADEESSQGWTSNLPWHVDGAYRPLTEEALAAKMNLSPAPRWLAFAVIYNAQRIPLTVASLDEIVERMDRQEIAALARDEFDVHSPASFGSPLVTSGVAILLPDGGGGYFSRFNQNKCFGRTSAARSALEGFSRALSLPDIRHCIDLEPGDIIILDNWRSLHARSAYVPRWDGRDRWLLRSYVAPTGQTSKPKDPSKPRVWL